MEFEVFKEGDLTHQFQRQWRWALAEELLTSVHESRVAEILNEVKRMDVSADVFSERVKVFKEKLDDLEEEGGIVLDLE